MTIVLYPHPVLRKKAASIETVSAAERTLLDDMAKTMYLKSGVGLAATQIGIDKQLAVIDVGAGLVKLVNPTIVRREGCETQEEGCLSVPQKTVRVRRAKRVTVRFLNENGEALQIVAEGLFARAIQHEVDHLSGRLIIDYLSPLKRILAKKRLTSPRRR